MVWKLAGILHSAPERNFAVSASGVVRSAMSSKGS